jgi:hypothetical protein
VEEVVYFPELNHPSLPYAIKQMIAHEVEMEIMRRKEGPNLTQTNVEIDEQKKNPPQDEKVSPIFDATSIGQKTIGQNYSFVALG